MEETLEQKKRRLFGKQYLSEYLGVIKKITFIENTELLSIVDTDEVIKNSSDLKKHCSYKFYFNEKLEIKKKIYDTIKYNGKFYLFTSLSQDCGCVIINSLNDINFNFNFEDDSSGIISLISFDLSEKILFDFYIENDKQLIEIEYYKK